MYAFIVLYRFLLVWVRRKTECRYVIVCMEENPYTVYGLQLTRNALKDDNKKMRGRKAEVENYVCCKD